MRKGIDLASAVAGIMLIMAGTGAAFYITAAVYSLFDSEFRPSIWIPLILPVLCCIPIFAGARIMYGKSQDDRERYILMRRAATSMLILYVFVLADLTLFDASLGRTGDEAVRTANYIPLRTIKTMYIDALHNGWVTVPWVVRNVAGNICALMPFALLLPFVYRKFVKWYTFIPTVFGIDCMIEILQLILQRGCFDVDDIILNMTGVLILFGVFNIPPVRKFLGMIFGIPWGGENVRSVRLPQEESENIPVGTGLSK